MTIKQLRNLVAAVVSGIPDLNYREAGSALIALGTLAQGVAAVFEPFKKIGKKKPLPKSTVKSPCTISVPYKGMDTVKRLIKSGKYDWSNTDVSDNHFPNTKQKTEKVRIELIHFDVVMTSENVFSKLKKMGLKAINVAELLALGKAHPDIQRQYPIIALGQKWRFSRSDSFVVCLVWHGMLRRIYLLSQLKREWPAHCRFPAIKICK